MDQTASNPPAKYVPGHLIPLNVGFLILMHVVGIGGTAWYVSNYGVHWAEIVAAVGFWIVSGLGVTAGYHRLFAHRTWRAPTPVRYVLATAGTLSFMKSIFEWCAQHRYHHREIDTDGDPYNAKRGFWFSHQMWMTAAWRHEGDLSCVQDLQRDPVCVWQNKYWMYIAAFGNLGACILLGLLTGRVLGMVLIAGFLRVVIVQHFTFCINSFAHMWGSQPWSTGDTSRDNWVLAIIAHGEGYHNFHHSFMGDYRNGHKWYHWDPSKWLIWSLERLGLASELRRTPVEALMRTRFQCRKSMLMERLRAFGEAVGHMGDRREEAKARMTEQLHAAEAKIEHALAELGTVRRNLSAAMADRASELRERRDAVVARDLRELKRAMAAARQSAHDALEHWEALAEQYSEQYALAMAPA